MSATSIEWTDHSVNPLRARYPATKGDGHYCEKVSPGCMRCYSSRTQPRFGMPVFNVQRRGGVEPYLHTKALKDVLKRRKPTKFFWCDMTDIFGAWVLEEWLDQCFAVMAATPHHVHQVLTKRPERALAYLTALGTPAGADRLERAARANGYSLRFHGVPLVPWPLPNVWLGVSCEDQQYADERIPLLLDTPAAIHWVSYEPALGAVNFRKLTLGGGMELDSLTGFHSAPIAQALPNKRPPLDWIVMGGESGPGARPCDRRWFYDVIRSRSVLGTALFLKQLGAKSHIDLNRSFLPLKDKKGGELAEWPEDLRIREYPRQEPS